MPGKDTNVIDMELDSDGVYKEKHLVKHTQQVGENYESQQDIRDFIYGMETSLGVIMNFAQMLRKM